MVWLAGGGGRLYREGTCFGLVLGPLVFPTLTSWVFGFIFSHPWASGSQLRTPLVTGLSVASKEETASLQIS